jgi:hypothetical protein
LTRRDAPAYSRARAPDARPDLHDGRVGFGGRHPGRPPQPDRLRGAARRRERARDRAGPGPRRARRAARARRRARASDRARASAPVPRREPRGFRGGGRRCGGGGGPERSARRVDHRPRLGPDAVARGPVPVQGVPRPGGAAEPGRAHPGRWSRDVGELLRARARGYRPPDTRSCRRADRAGRGRRTHVASLSRARAGDRRRRATRHRRGEAGRRRRPRLPGRGPPRALLRRPGQHRTRPPAPEELELRTR